MEQNEAATTAEATENTQENTATEATAQASETPETTETTATEAAAEPENAEEISYHSVEKEGSVTAIWEMQGQKHLRTIDPRSAEGKNILSLFETAA